MITYTIERVYRRTIDDGVFSIQATASKTRDGHTVTHSAMVAFEPDPTAEGFIPFADLTEEVVTGWVENAADTVRLNNILDELLELAINPPTIEGLPWA